MRRLLFVLALVPLLVHATEPLGRDEIPEPLKSWLPWVLKSPDTETSACAFLHRNQERRCAWPARLKLTLDDKGGRFTQQWRIQHEEWVPLPGDPKHWPLDVRVDNAPAIVVETNGSPRLRLRAGDRVVSGTFAWDSVPESLNVPPETGIVDLSVRGVRVPIPNRDVKGLLYLSNHATPAQEENLEVSVERKITDEIPLLLTTRIELNVSGKAREVLLGRALPQGFTPLLLDSPLPVRLEAEDRPRVQVRPGVWVITLVARHQSPVESIARPDPKGTWAAGEEIWVFEPRPEVRLVNVEGVSSIDPQQTRLPDDWKRFAAYPLAVGDTLRLAERRRGDADPAPDQLALNRELWLDFDGRGYAIKDTLTGKLTRSSRLTMGPETQLGRVEIGGRDQFITRLEGGATGVEVRDVILQVVADSRIDGRRTDIPAVSWSHDFQSVNATLHLPPGWKLFHAAGADDVPGTWVKQWTLLDLFLLLLTGFAVGRLFGPLWGAVALLTLTLSLQETQAPQWIWLAVVAGEALVRALPTGKVKSLFRFYRLGAVAVLVVVCIAFLVQNVRSSLYPALERPYSQVSFDDDGLLRSRMSVPGKPPGREAPETPPPTAVENSVLKPEDHAKEDANTPEPRLGQAKSEGAAQEEQRAGGRGAYDSWEGQKTQANRQMVQDVDRTVAVQTGPGLPQWLWEDVAIRWSGPVEHLQHLQLYYLSPGVNRALAFLRLFLIAALVARLLPLPRGRWPQWLGRMPGATTALAFLLGAGAALTPRAARAELPSPELLQELRERVVVPAECVPDCATNSRLALEATSDALTLRLEVHAAASTAVPLPGHADQWVPENVNVDGKPAAGLYRSPEGVLWLPLEPGTHQVLLQGSLPRWESVQVALPLKPHWMQAKLAGWTLAGLHEDGQADADLQLTRERGTKGDKDAVPLQSSTLPPFVHVRRQLSLALDWEVDTEVVRASPEGSAIVLEIPLLPGESVTSPDVRVAGNKALVNLGARATRLAWHSTLPRVSALKLSAPAETAWVEEWRLDVSPLWHVTYGGIPPVHRGSGGEQVPEFRPWPGESVTIEVQRPQGVPGQTLTVDQTQLMLRPGLRATDVSLSLSLRSSRGGQHTVLLPENAQLQTVTLNSVEQPIRQEGRKVTLPTGPGAQLAVLSWREPRGMGLLFQTPVLDVGAPTVNAHTELEIPSDRWILFAGGPRLGPSVLFWSMLLVLLLVSYGLSRSTLTPLKLHHWVLLSLGLSQVPWVAVAVVAGWFLLIGWRGKDAPPLSRWLFNLRQMFLVAWSAAALVVLGVAIQGGLLGHPDMQIGGNGSSASVLRWFADRTGPELSRAWVLSVPVLVYRLAMLAWALWLARALLRWLRWGWAAFNSGGLWKGAAPKAVPVPPP